MTQREIQKPDASDLNLPPLRKSTGVFQPQKFIRVVNGRRTSVTVKDGKETQVVLPLEPSKWIIT